MTEVKFYDNMDRHDERIARKIDISQYSTPFDGRGKEKRLFIKRKAYS